LLAEDKVIVELKAVPEFHPAHTAQVISYLKATGLKVALLVNFGKDKIDYKTFYFIVIIKVFLSAQRLFIIIPAMIY